METLVVAQHRNQYYHHGSGCSASKGFSEINCRFFQSESTGVVRPNPFRSCDDVFSYEDEKACSSPKTPVSYNSPKFRDNHRYFTSNGKSKAKAIRIVSSTKASNESRSLIDEFAYPELWAGPAYSNSPPPSSLPIPKFSLRQKRSASFELPSKSLANVTMRPLAKSAPPSPGREPCASPSNSFLSMDSATKDLRRILHLDDIGDE